MNELDKVRSQIDWIDRDIMAQLDKRFELVEKVKEIKKEINMPVLDKSREETIKHYIELNTKFEKEIKNVYEEIMKQSKELQNE